MKRILFTLTLLFFAASLMWAQENLVSLSGGYSFANFDITDSKATGWRINGAYEFNPWSGNLSQGIVLGYISTTAIDSDGLQDLEYGLSSWPFYFAPKYIFGNERIKGFVKGALGMHFSKYERIGGLTLSEKYIGFYGGVSVGAMLYLSDKVFLNAEYEWAYMSNIYYSNGFMNSALLGIGLSF